MLPGAAAAHPASAQSPRRLLTALLPYTALSPGPSPVLPASEGEGEKAERAASQGRPGAAPSAAGPPPSPQAAGPPARGGAAVPQLRPASRLNCKKSSRGGGSQPFPPAREMKQPGSASDT